MAFGTYAVAIPTVARWAIWALTTGSLSWLVYRFVEEPGIKLGVRLAEGFQLAGNAGATAAPR